MLNLLGLPSLSEIVAAIAKDFFGALAHALVPEWLSHATVATIQHLVALPDPASWGHISQLQADMSLLGVSLLPAVLAASTLRYWLVGLTGGPHPTVAVGRAAWVTFALVAYRWIVAQTVDAANTLTHAILGFPLVAHGLSRIIVLLFGAGLLGGTGGVLGALLVIVGVILAVALFAVQELATLVLALLVVGGPPLIALSVVPELSHLARAWAHLLLAICLIPLAWTVIFATAGALVLDASSFTGGAGGLPGHVEAAFAALATFLVAIGLPLMLLRQAGRILGVGAMTSSRSQSADGPQAQLPGVERVRAANARLRNAALVGVPSLGRSAGQAAGALGAPQGGAIGAARRGAARAGLRSGMLSAGAADRLAGTALGSRHGGEVAAAASGGRGRGIRRRLADAGAIVAQAPGQARVAMQAAADRAAGKGGRGSRHANRPARRAGGGKASGGGESGRRPTGPLHHQAQEMRPNAGSAKQASRPEKQRRRRKARPAPAAGASVSPDGRNRQGDHGADGGGNPGRRVAGQAQREAQANAPSSAEGTTGAKQTQPAHSERSSASGRRPGDQRAAASNSERGKRPAPPRASAGKHRGPRRVRRKPRPGDDS